MTIDEAFEACRYRLVVREQQADVVGNLTGLEWDPEGETLLATISGYTDCFDVLDLERVHPDDLR